jgi:hypothetical protein
VVGKVGGRDVQHLAYEQGEAAHENPCTDYDKLRALAGGCPRAMAKSTTALQTLRVPWGIRMLPSQAPAAAHVRGWGHRHCGVHEPFTGAPGANADSQS